MSTRTFAVQSLWSNAFNSDSRSRVSPSIAARPRTVRKLV
jgi:hypothetical protein